MCSRIIGLWYGFGFFALMIALSIITNYQLNSIQSAIAMFSAVLIIVVFGGCFAWLCTRKPLPLSEESIKRRQEANYKALALGDPLPYPEIKITEKRKGGPKHVATEPWNEVN